LGGIGYSPHLGDPAGALIHHVNSLALIERWRASHPEEKSNNVEIALREELIAIDFTRLLRFSEAETHIRRAIAVLPSEQPGIGAPGDPRTWCIVRSCYGWILIAAGNAREAVPVLHEAMQGAAKLVAADPKNVRAQLDLSIAEGALGRATYLSAHGVAHLHRAIVSEESLLKVDPWHAELRGALARHYLWAGESGLRSGDWNEARRFYQQAAGLAAETSARQASDLNAIENLASAHLGLAQAESRLGDAAESAGNAGRAAKEAQQILSAHAENPVARRVLDMARSPKL
jgi:tetratricopeptide (TPR) repeat protein